MREWAGVGRYVADQLLERKAGVGSIVLDVLLETKGVGSTEPEELLEWKTGVGSVVPDALLEKKGVGSTDELRDHTGVSLAVAGTSTLLMRCMTALRERGRVDG